MERSGKACRRPKRRLLIHDEIRADYDAQADPRYGAARLWIDAIIDPAKHGRCSSPRLRPVR